MNSLVKRFARALVILLAVFFASCGGQDAKESQIVGRWQTDAIGANSNSVFLILTHDENAISGHADVNGGVYDLEGRWEGPLGPDETIDLELDVLVRGLSITGTGTLSAGGEDRDVSVNGRRTGMAFDFKVSPEGGQDLKVSGRIGYDMNNFRLQLDVEGIETVSSSGQTGTIRLNVRGTRRGGGFDWLTSAAASR